MEHLDEYEIGEGRLQRQEKIERTATSLFLTAIELANLLDAVERKQEEAAIDAY